MQIWKLLQGEQVDVGRIWKCVAKLLVEFLVHLGIAQHLKDPTASRGASRLSTSSRDVDGVSKDSKIGQRLSDLGRKLDIFERGRLNQVVEYGAPGGLDTERYLLPDFG